MYGVRGATYKYSDSTTNQLLGFVPKTSYIEHPKPNIAHKTSQMSNTNY